MLIDQEEVDQNLWGRHQKNLDEMINSITLDTNKEKTKFKGQPIPAPAPRLSAVIPLKFNLKLDGISGIVIGNVFKLPKNRLPFGDEVQVIVNGHRYNLS